MTETTFSKCPTCGNLVVSKEVGPLKLYEKANIAVWRDHEIKLSHKPFKILMLLIQNSGQPLSKEYMHDKLFSYNSSLHNTAVHIGYLRNAFKKVDPTFNCIQTMNCIGYIWKYEP